MHPIEIVILLLALVIVLYIIARKLRVIFPVFLTLSGLLISLVPGVPEIQTDPSLVLLVFLPPILYAAAWYTNVREFFKNLEPIVLLALGLVLATSIGIAYLAWWLIPGFTLFTGFLLGAIVSPPDAVAATAVLKQVKVPKKIVSILEGESLVNDATALVSFQIALLAISTGSFSWSASVGKFLTLSAGGIAVGGAVGYGAYLLHRHFKMERSIETILTFVTAYAAYILAEKLHFSGVLGVVTAGLWMGSQQSLVHSARMRIQAVAVWDFVIVLLNGLIFILIGMQLPGIIRHIPETDLPTLLGYGLLVSLGVILIRVVYIYFLDSLSNRIRKALGLPPVFPSKKHTTVLAYTAMRGIVSLAAAFSIPLYLQGNQAFPNRDMILFLSFSVVLFTLVFQGLSLPKLVQRLNFSGEAGDHTPLKTLRKQLANLVKDLGPTASVAQTIRLQRRFLVDLKNQDRIDIEHFHLLENELDLEEARTEREEPGI